MLNKKNYYIKELLSMSNSELLSKGEYFADYDESTEMYCVFHTTFKTGFAFSSWASIEQAEQDAENRNNN
jgi:hypothetical protein